MFNYIVCTYNGENLTVVFILTPRLFFQHRIYHCSSKRKGLCEVTHTKVEEGLRDFVQFY